MKINFLDHVAIKVNDLQKSADWYQKHLGLEIFKDEENWGPFPIMVLAGESGIALFPNEPKTDLTILKTKSHIAFNVDLSSLIEFKNYFSKNEITYEEEDYYHFSSIFINDPDGYQIELTARNN